MNESTFNRIRQLVYERSGISLGDNKQALVRARIAKRMRRLNMNDYGQYLKYVVDDNSGEEIQEMLDAISTNVTSFYREPSHFDFMRDVIEGWMSQGPRSLRLWSAACSTGEEPYNMAIEALEACGSRKVDIRVLATDISTRVLEIAMEGQYSEDRIEPVPKNLRSKYFTRYRMGDESIYRANDELKKMLVIRQFNLSITPYPIKKPLDIIFCRNVMIYFDSKVRKSMVGEFHRVLKPGGYLMVGHAESITGLCDGFRCLKPSVYIKE